MKIINNKHLNTKYLKLINNNNLYNINTNTVLQNITLNKIYKFINKILLLKNSNILFVLSPDKKYKGINNKFISLLKKTNHLYINKSWVSGFLTNYKELKIIKKKPTLVCILYPIDDLQKKYIIKESMLLNIPIMSTVDQNNIKSSFDLGITFPLYLENMNKNHLFFYYIMYFLIKNTIKK